MNTTKLKRFATEARLNLMEGVRRKLHLLGFDRDGTPFAQPELIQGGALWNEEEYPESFYQQWTTLRDRLSERGVRELVEEAAYTWFNRMMAIRILTMNGLCEPILRFDPATGLPLLLADARMGRVPEMSTQERSRFDKLMDDDNRTYDQFALLLTVWCHDNPIIRSCFGSIHDYVELLLPDNILRPDGFLAKLNDTPFITEEDFKSAELIGWLYQFYISDRKDEVFAKKGKVEAEEIPAATQIFTPNWIVKYMVENTILPQVEADDEILEKAKYLVKPAKVGTHGSCVRGRKVELEDLKVADFACGSGHILNECFDLLFALYRAESYSRRESIECIFTKNLTGIDIDLRAKQLATFALLLKACRKDSSFADAHCMPHVITVPEIEDELFDLEEPQTIAGYLHHFFLGSETKECSEQLTEAIALLKDADSLGSIIKFDLSSSTRRQLVEAVAHWENRRDLPQAIKSGLPIMDFILTLTDTYDAIVMNPPYMPTSKVDGLKDYAVKNYPDSKTDLFSVFMDVCMDRLKDGGKYGMINMQSWMFLSSFEALRKKIIETQHIDSLLHLGPRTFDELSGEVVQNATFVISKDKPQTPGIYYRLIDGKNCNAKREMFLADENLYVVEDQSQFEKIPGAPVAYWVSEKLFESIISSSQLMDYSNPTRGFTTGNNDRYLKLWHEVNLKNIGFQIESWQTLTESTCKWIPCTKGGSFRKWYGNLEHIVWVLNGGVEIQNEICGSWTNKHTYFVKEGSSWSVTGAHIPSFRFLSKNWLFEHKGNGMFPLDGVSNNYLIGYLNSKVFDAFSKIFFRSLDLGEGTMKIIPFSYRPTDFVYSSVQSSIQISKLDWDAHETSWDFQTNPLVLSCYDMGGGTLEDSVADYEHVWERKFFQLHANEEELNRQFIEIYGLQDELTPDVSFDEITILQQGEISWEKGDWEEGVLRPDTNSQEETARGRASSQSSQSQCFISLDEPISVHGDRLQHWNQEGEDGKYVFFTFRLADSLPKEKQDELKSKMAKWTAVHPKPWDEATEKEYHKLFSNKIEDWLDNGYGCCILGNPVAAKIVEDTMKYNDGKKYELIDYVIMPNHVHVLVRLYEGLTVETLMQEWKSVSSHKLHKAFPDEWCGWMEKYHDRHIRNEVHFDNVIGYIYKNFCSVGGRAYWDEGRHRPDTHNQLETARGRASSQLNWHEDVIIKQLISYIVGCYMGRYRLDRVHEKGLHIAHPEPTEEELAKYQIPNSKYQFEIDSDGIIPVLPQGAPFYDNLYNYVEQFVKMVWGETHLQENMNFIEKCLGKPLNDYLMKDFWKYHKKMYQNRPIYWEFASNKGAFRTLVYAHRMDRFTVEVLRSKYLLPYIAHIEKKVANMESRAADLSTPERRELDTLRDKTLPELREYADRVEVVALKNITFDLDDGIIRNHALFGDIVTKLK